MRILLLGLLTAFLHAQDAFLVKPFGLTQLQSAIVAARKRTFHLDRDNYYKLTPAHLQVA